MSPAMDVPSQTATLVETGSSLLDLLRRFLEVLSNGALDEGPQSDSPDPLDVLHTSAQLLKAHTTKISLFVINKPYTPTAIRTVLSEVAGTCVPAMMSAVQMCHPSRYGRFLHDEINYRVRRVFKELESMLQEILAQAKSVEDETRGSAQDKPEPKWDSLASTGVIWEKCDELGIAGLAVKRAEQHRSMLEDAIAELKEWKEEETDEGFEDDEDSLEISDGEGSIERVLTAAHKLPHDRDDLKATLDVALRKLKLMSTLYQAIVKRRLKTFTKNPKNLAQMDALLKLLSEIPDLTDELASAFYDLDDHAARNFLGDVCGKGRDVIELTRMSWTGQEDEFSAWSTRWLEALGEHQQLPSALT